MAKVFKVKIFKIWSFKNQAWIRAYISKPYKLYRRIGGFWKILFSRLVKNHDVFVSRTTLCIKRLNLHAKENFLGKCLFEHKNSFAVEIKNPDILGQKWNYSKNFVVAIKNAILTCSICGSFMIGFFTQKKRLFLRQSTDFHAKTRKKIFEVQWQHSSKSNKIFRKNFSKFKGRML